MELGKLISKAISCVDSYINPPTEKELKDKRKTEFYVYISQFPEFMAIDISLKREGDKIMLNEQEP